MPKKVYDMHQVEENSRKEDLENDKTTYDTIALMGTPPSKTKKICISLLAVLIGAAFIVAAVIIGTQLSSNNNNSPPSNNNPIVQQYSATAQQIIKYMTNGTGKGQGFDWIANLTDTFGPRKAGTQALQDAVDYLVDLMKKQNFSNVHTDSAYIPLWIRGEEVANLLQPRQKKMSILGLGSTMYTPPEGITAKAIVVRDFAELDHIGNTSNKINGSIVVYNNEWINYGVSVRYRSEGAVNAAKYGAVAVLVRSVASYTIYSPHTGGQDTPITNYSVIPAASITVEDAEMLYRMQQRGQYIEIYLNINSTLSNFTEIYNTVFDLPGSEFPNEIVMVSGHIDSWDVGQGAMDNAAGASLAWQTITTLMALNLRPKRTIRGIFWTAEEQGHVGSLEYFEKHRNDVTNETYVFLMESDEGLFSPMNLSFAGTMANFNIFQQLMPLVNGLNVSAVSNNNSLGDTVYWNTCDGVPGVFLNSVDEGYQQYFAYHHSNGDMPNIYTPDQVDNGGAIFAVIAYVMADMDTVMTPLDVNNNSTLCQFNLPPT